MSTVVIGCDINTGKDHDWQDTVAKVLEENGHTTEKLQIAPNPFAAYSYNSKAKGKIGVYIIADGLFSIGDLFYGNTYFKYAYFLIRGDLGHTRMDSESDFKNNPIAADADTRGEAAKLAGKTYPQMNKITKSKCLTVWGGKTPKEGAKNLISAMGGSTSSDSESSGSTIKNAIQEVLYGWNGEAYCYVRDDTMHIGRIPSPTTAELYIVEGDNVYEDSVSITDIAPEMTNKLTVNWGNETYVIKDDERIKRFGEIAQTIDATDNYEKDIISFAYREWNKLLKDSERVLECKVKGDSKWRVGKWVRVYMPSWNLDGFMWITKCSHDDSGVWDTNLTLTDYPPDLGKKPSETNTEEEEDEESEEDSDSEEEEE